MRKLAPIRHAELEWNKSNTFVGWADVDMTQNWHEEAQRAGRHLFESGYNFHITFTFVLKRAISLACPDRSGPYVDSGA